MSDDSKSSAEIERDVEASRARLEGTLGDLRDRMSPGQIVDEVFAYAKRSGGGEITRNLGRSMRENPLPLLLVGAGIGWMMLNSGGRDARDRGWPGEDYGQGRWAGWENGHRGPPPAGGIGTDAEGPGLAARVVDGVAHAGEAVGSAASAAYHGAADVYHGIAGAAEGAGHAAGRAASAAGHMGDRIAHGAGGVASGARAELDHVGRATRDGWRYLVEEQPLVLAAIGVAVGAAIGAVIPSTGIENRAMGARAEEVKRTVGDAASRQIDTAKDVVEDAYDGASEALDRQHLADTAVGAIDAVADRVRDAVAPDGHAKGNGAQSV